MSRFGLGHSTSNTAATVTRRSTCSTRSLHHASKYNTKDVHNSVTLVRVVETKGMFRVYGDFIYWPCIV